MCFLHFFLDSQSRAVHVQHHKELAENTLYSMPVKAIEASIKMRKNKKEKSEFGIRRDVVHKAIFRAMRRHFFKSFEQKNSPVEATKENFKDLVVNYIKENLVDFDSLPEAELPGKSISQEGILLVMMTIISQKLTKSWSYKLKNQSFNKNFTKVMSKYSFALCLKLFENKNFKLVAQSFLTGEGFNESIDEMSTMKENLDAYEDARVFFLSH